MHAYYLESTRCYSCDDIVRISGTSFSYAPELREQVPSQTEPVKLVGVPSYMQADELNARFRCLVTRKLGSRPFSHGIMRLTPKNKNLQIARPLCDRSTSVYAIQHTMVGRAIDLCLTCLPHSAHADCATVAEIFSRLDLANASLLDFSRSFQKMNIRIDTFDFSDCFTNIRHDDAMNAWSFVSQYCASLSISGVWVSCAKGFVRGSTPPRKFARFKKPNKSHLHSWSFISLAAIGQILYHMLSNLFFHIGGDKKSSTPPTLGMQTSGVTMGGQAACAICRLVLTTLEFRGMASTDCRLWLDNCPVKFIPIRYVDDVAMISCFDSSLNVDFVNESLRRFMNALWPKHIPLKPAQINPSVGLYICFHEKRFSWFPAFKSVDCQGNFISSSGSRIRNTLQSACSFVPPSVRLATFTSAFARCFMQSSSLELASFSCAIACKYLCVAGHQPKLVHDMCFKYAWSKFRHHTGTYIVSRIKKAISSLESGSLPAQFQKAYLLEQRRSFTCPFDEN